MSGLNANPRQARPPLRAGTLMDKYRLERRLSNGPYAAVFQAFDTIEGIRVALKIPHAHSMDSQFLDDFRKEVRLSAKLDHPHILPVKNAGFLEGYFVIVTPLGEKTLAERLQSRLALRKVLDYMEQALEALAFAHGERIIHCDIKPENFILFPGDYLRLTDFGIAKVGMRTVAASGSGTVGYVAPEQAMGRPSFKSDVFSMGLILYRMLSGHLPEWPFLWPPAGFDRVRRRTHPDLIALIRRAMEVKPARRFPDATHMLEAFLRVKKKALRYASLQARRRKARTVLVPLAPNWKEVRTRQFQRLFGRALETRLTCHACGGPVSEPMHYCPWCGKVRKPARESTRFPVRCPRCKRGVKLDWRYCPWCFGERIGEEGGRSYSDRRYASRCMNSRCTRKDLMAFMRYCPWCRRKVQRPWKLPGSKDRCASCGWGVLPAFWNVCPWCGKTIKK